MIDSLIEFDIELFLYLNNLGNIQWDGFWMFMTHKFGAIPLYLLLLFLSYKQFGTKTTIVIVLFIAVLIGITDQTSNLFKYGFERLRPCHDESLEGLFRLVKERCGGLYSYFSAHAANSMAIAIFFGLLLRRRHKFLPLALIAWATIVGYSRIYIGVHFPLDVFTGFFFGSMYAAILYRVFSLIREKYL
ncbi:phosphatase PAP2 family protein [bacterium AH-315-A23]|nr:phosphatase PAP2 family protein [bacterium AH-315-A23]PHS51810.1 MAG: phosphatase PAP2 family protein [Lutibacter sp.]